jgi:hypothetical protein
MAALAAAERNDLMFIDTANQQTTFSNETTTAGTCVFTHSNAPLDFDHGDHTHPLKGVVCVPRDAVPRVCFVVCLV